MLTVTIIIALIAAILLIFIVLVQNPKGGGIASNFSAANQIVGVKKTNDFVEKATWTLAIVLLLTAFVSSYFNTSSVTKESIMKEQLENSAITPETAPAQIEAVPGTPAPMESAEEPK